MAGVVEEINLAAEHGALPAPIDRVRATAGEGLDGEVHRNERPGHPGKALTLIEAEALEAFTAETGIPLTAAESRRNLLTRGVDLNGLVGRRFYVGEILCEGVELCEPCRQLERWTRPGVLRGMVHRAGLNADVLTSGEIAVGDRVTPA